MFKRLVVITCLVAANCCLVVAQEDRVRRSKKAESGKTKILSPIPSQLAGEKRIVPPAPQDFLPDFEALRVDVDETGSIKLEATITLAELSLLAYTAQHNREIVLRLLECEKVVTLDDGAMSGFMAMKDDVVVVAFRGTNPLSPGDWLANIDLFWQKSMGNGRKFHKGFQDSYARFADMIKLNLRGRQPKYIWLTGHSLGGAMAVCCAYDWIISRMPLTGVVTFGQPRVANPRMANFLTAQIGSRLLRYRNGDDIVPTVPPKDSWFTPEYQHAGKEVWYRDGALSKAKAALGKDITAEELIELQEYLRRQQTPEQVAAIPAMLKSNVDRKGLILRRNADPEIEMKSMMQAKGVASKFSDHSILEYIRVLNDLRQKENE